MSLARYRRGRDPGETSSCFRFIQTAQIIDSILSDLMFCEEHVGYAARDRVRMIAVRADHGTFFDVYLEQDVVQLLQKFVVDHLGLFPRQRRIPDLPPSVDQSSPLDLREKRAQETGIELCFSQFYLDIFELKGKVV